MPNFKDIEKLFPCATSPKFFFGDVLTTLDGDIGKVYGLEYQEPLKPLDGIDDVNGWYYLIETETYCFWFHEDSLKRVADENTKE